MKKQAIQVLALMLMACVGCQPEEDLSPLRVDNMEVLERVCKKEGNVMERQLLVDASFVSELKGCTQLSCPGEACCKDNVCNSSFWLSCRGSSEPDIALLRGPEASWPEAQEWSYKDGPMGPVKDQKVGTVLFGCGGPECHQVCTHDLAKVGVFYGSLTSNKNGNLSLIVSKVE